jgi:hypothetical protein
MPSAVQRSIVVACCLFALARSSSGQPVVVADSSAVRRYDLTAVRLTVPLRIDGVLDDEPWRDAPAAADFVQSEPYEGDASTERTDVRVLYDSENLYIGITCYDSEPESVRVNTLKEDFDPEDADYIQIILDTYHDQRSGFLFVTNPMGARRDAQVSDEGRTVNVDWDTVWEVRARPTDEGWTAEIAIPFKSLSFDRDRPAQVWGINVARKIRRKNEIGFWAPVPRRYDITRLSLAGQLHGLETLEQGRNLRVKPFGVTDVESFARRTSTDLAFDAGLDVKYSVTPSLTLDLTANTDFSQVEVDEQQINLTRFPVIFPEKREFFLENSGIFQFGDIPGERGPDRAKETQLFFSRRIGLFPDGHPRQGEQLGIWGGARVSGRVGPYGVGLFSIQTKAVDDDPRTAPNERLASNNFTVARVKRNVLANSDVGAIFIARESEENDDNRAWGVDGNFRFGQNFAVNGYVARTSTPDLGCGDSCQNRADKVSANWRDNRVRLQAVYANIQEHFNPEVGLKGVPSGRDSARSLRTTAEFHLRPPRNPWFREVNPHHRTFMIWDPDGRRVYREGHYSPLEVFLHNGSRFEISYNPRVESLDEPFRVPGSGNVAVPPGLYEYGYWQLELVSDPSKAIFGTADMQTGSYYTGHSRTVSASATFRPGYRWSAQATVVNSDVSLQGADYTDRIVRTRLAYSMSTRMFLNALFQYNSTRRQVTSNVRLHFIHRPLSDLFFVLNETRDVSGAGASDRVFTIKYTHMFAF